VIRRFSPDDWLDMFEYLSQESVVKYEPYGAFTEDDCKKEAVRRAKDDSFWAVCLKDSGKLIGNIYFAERDFDTWELGYVFNEDYQGMGHAAEAARALVDDAFSSGRARRVAAMCNPLNEPSWKLLERLGMRLERHLRKNVFFKKDKNGEPIWQDTYEYGILVDEWFSRT
jgi:Acetyltransferases, including N-acetylases of ribosomal proteins